MKKIELSNDEIKVIKQQLNGEIEVWSATDEQKRLLMGVIHKAEELQNELDAIDEVMAYPDCDLILWFFDKYKKQEGIK